MAQQGGWLRAGASCGATAHREFAAGERATEAISWGEDVGGGFFARCLAANRGSTPAEHGQWRECIYSQIRRMMPMQGSLSVERMCRVAGVSRASFYRWLEPT